MPRTLPLRKTHGTAYNLEPDTARTLVRDIRVGDVVMEGPEHPVRVERITRSGSYVRLWVRYVWSEPWDRPWPLNPDGHHPGHVLDRAHPGEYPRT